MFFFLESTLIKPELCKNKLFFCIRQIKGTLPKHLGTPDLIQLNINFKYSEYLDI